jgi:hypothetical protein
MKKFLFALVVVSLLATISSPAQARGYRVPHIKVQGVYKVSRTIKYGYTLHRLTRVRCAYAGCRSDIKP